MHRPLLQLTLENQRVGEAGIFQKAGYGFHTMLSRDDSTRLDFESYVVDWQTDELEAILINETPTDFVCYHGTRSGTTSMTTHCL